MQNSTRLIHNKPRFAAILGLVIFLVTVAAGDHSCGREYKDELPTQTPHPQMVYKGTASKTIQTQNSSFEDLTCVLSGTATLTLNVDNTVELDILMPDILGTNSCDGNGDQVQDRVYGLSYNVTDDGNNSITFSRCNVDETASGSGTFADHNNAANGTATCSYKGTVDLVTTFSVALSK